MRGNYDAVAPFYDSLARLVFGRDITDAQTCFLSFLPPRSHILVVGGGTGWILDKIAQQQPEGFSITYVEISERMLQRSQDRKTGLHEVKFLHAPIQEARILGKYDAVITPFLFDNFSWDTADEVFRKLHFLLKEDGIWFFTDFQVGHANLRSRVLLKAMYSFFGFLCHLENRSLPDTDKLFLKNGYTLIQQKWFSGKFILSQLYQK